MRHPKVEEDRHTVAYSKPAVYDPEDAALIDAFVHEVQAHEQQAEAEDIGELS